MKDHCPGVCEKPECHQKMVVIMKDSSSSAIIKCDDNKVHELITALVADKLIEKDNFTLSIKKGILSLNSVVQSEEVTKKYLPMITAAGDTEIVMKTEKK